MTTVVRKEQRQRTPFGKAMKWIFVAFNVLMLMWLLDATIRVSAIAPPQSGAEKVGMVIGATLGYGFLCGTWAFGGIILGIFVLLTRGDVVVVEQSATYPQGGESMSPTMNADEMIARYRQQQADRPASTLRASASAVPAQPSFGKRR